MKTILALTTLALAGCCSHQETIIIERRGFTELEIPANWNAPEPRSVLILRELSTSPETNKAFREAFNAINENRHNRINEK